MKILVDTCTFLWWALGDAQVPAGTRRLLTDPANEVHLSAVSIWEIAIKHAIGRLGLPESPERWVPVKRARYGLDLLPIGEAEALHVGKLPPIHRDPFDRMLVAQSICHGLELATPDPNIQKYPCRILWPA